MKTRHARFLVVVLFAGATVGLPGSTSAQEILDACNASAALAPPAPFGHEVTGSANYTCDNEHLSISVVGCLLLNGAPVACDGNTRMNSPSASVDLAFPCLPGVWTTLAIGLGADRALPATDVDGPVVVTECDPLHQPPSS
jgi:hypothetical protein